MDGPALAGHAAADQAVLEVADLTEIVEDVEPDRAVRLIGLDLPAMGALPHVLDLPRAGALRVGEAYFGRLIARRAVKRARHCGASG